MKGLIMLLENEISSAIHDRERAGKKSRFLIVNYDFYMRLMDDKFFILSYHQMKRGRGDTYMGLQVVKEFEAIEKWRIA